MNADPFSPYAVTGLNPGSAPATTSCAVGMKPAISNSAGPSAENNAPLWHPDHPLFWVAGLIGVTIGLIGVNSSVRVGKIRASVGAGNS